MPSSASLLDLLQLAEAEKEQKRLAFEKALALPDEKPISEEASSTAGVVGFHGRAAAPAAYDAFAAVKC